MIRRGVVEILGIGILVCLLALFLFGDKISGAPSDFIGSISREISAISQNSSTQWMVLACFVFYLVTFSIFELRSLHRRILRVKNPIFWQSLFVASTLLSYGFAYSTASKSATILILFSTLVFGKVVAFWVYRKSESVEFRFSRILAMLMLALAASSLWQQKDQNTFQYHQMPRWSGPWDNPNLFGLLMGVAVLLSLARGTLAWKAGIIRLPNAIWAFSCALTFLLCSFGLIKSFSRGAWLGTIIGLVYFFWSIQRNSILEWTVSTYSKLWRSRRCLGIILVALYILGFWQFRFTEWRPASRMFSVLNINDFSWRNRAVAWQGASQMMSDRPWFGFGWGNAEANYGKNYLPRQLENGAAIQMNDYLMLGISAGVPALVCFLMYVGLSLKGGTMKQGKETGERWDARPTLYWLKTTCRVGAIVLLVGFFFDGGLFKLATGSVFWILLELGRVEVDRGGADARRAEVSVTTVPTSAKDAPENCARGTCASHKLTPWEIWLRRSAWILGIAAVSESTLLLATPLFGVNNTTLAISRHFLVPPSAVADLNLLATNVDWNGRKLRPLLQHTSLANYNRHLINWRLDQQIYRDYVLNPLIEPQRDGQLAWRRKLWEYFYLPMRKENDPMSAAQIVQKFLRQRIIIVPAGPATIEEMWQEKRADANSVQALEVAAFRSVGIPARLNNDGYAEVFADGRWRVLPYEP